MKTFIQIKGLVVMLVLACLPCGVAAQGLSIFAAASLQGPLDVVTAEYDSEATISYGGSGTLARQISLRAPADVVILANETWANWLFEKGHVAARPRALFSNRLVVIAPVDAPLLSDPDGDTLLALLKGGRLAMGQHQSVPAGIYAKDWLTRIDAWDSLRAHLAETENVRAALALVARKEAPLGIVYASDALASSDVRIVWSIPEDQHSQILYHGLALTPAGDAFLDHVMTRTALFEAAGFVAIP